MSGEPDLNLEYLKANCKKIHYFGLGFIQVKISDSQRYHFYTEDTLSIVGPEEIHNHRYDFQSRIMKGQLVQTLWRVIPGRRCMKWYETCTTEGDPSLPPPVECDIEITSDHTYVAGSSYSINHDIFHHVTARNCITRLIRGAVKKPYAEVIRDAHAQKVCPFSKQIPEDELWAIVARMLQR